MNNIDEILEGEITEETALSLIDNSPRITSEEAGVCSIRADNSNSVRDYKANLVYRILLASFSSKRKAAGFHYDQAAKSAEELGLLKVAYVCRKRACKIYDDFRMSEEWQFANNEVKRLAQIVFNDDKLDKIIDGNK